MANIAELNLDIKKTNDVQVNKTIILRQGDNTDTMKVYIHLNGLPFTDIKSATFFAEKPDQKIIANDPANIEDGNVISYPIPSQLTAAMGNITEAYFMINGTSTTDSFRILILKGVNLSGDSTNYIPGLSELNDQYAAVTADWLSKLNGMKTSVDNIDVDSELQTIIGAAIDKAKENYVAEYNKSAKAIDDLISKADGKNADLTNEINKITIAVSNSEDFLKDVRKQIIDSNAKFTADQQEKVTTELANLSSDIDATKKLSDKLNGQVVAIQKSIDDVNIPKINADTQTAMNNSQSAIATANTATQTAQNTDKKIGNLPADSNVMNEINKSQLITSATLNGNAVPINNKSLTITVPNPDLSPYATNSSVDSKISPLANKTDILVNGATLNGTAVPISNKTLNITVPQPNLTGYATNASVDSKLKDFAKSKDTIAPGTILGRSQYHFEQSVGTFIDKDNNKRKYDSDTFAFDKPVDLEKIENGIAFLVADALPAYGSATMAVTGLLSTLGFDYANSTFMSDNSITSSVSVMTIAITKQQMETSGIYPKEAGMLIPVAPVFIKAGSINGSSIKGLSFDGHNDFTVSMDDNFFKCNMTIKLNPDLGKSMMVSSYFNVSDNYISIKKDSGSFLVTPGMQTLAAVAY